MDQARFGSGNPLGWPSRAALRERTSIRVLSQKRKPKSGFIHWQRPLGVSYVLVSGLQVLILVVLPARCGEKSIRT